MWGQDQPLMGHMNWLTAASPSASARKPVRAFEPRVRSQTTSPQERSTERDMQPGAESAGHAAEGVDHRMMLPGGVVEFRQGEPV